MDDCISWDWIRSSGVGLEEDVGKTGSHVRGSGSGSGSSDALRVDCEFVRGGQGGCVVVIELSRRSSDGDKDQVQARVLATTLKLTTPDSQLHLDLQDEGSRSRSRFF